MPQAKRQRSSTDAAGLAGMFAAAAMIANQVGSKATRDALFLSTYDITTLPTMLIVAAIVSLGVVTATSRAMIRFTPARLIPAAFAASAVLLLVEALLAERIPRVAAVAVYLHVAVFGSILISGFWSMVNERFDPRTAKRLVGRIAGGGALGGLVGGLAAERTAVLGGAPLMLALLAILHIGCSFLTLRLRPPAARGAPRAGDEPAPSGLRVLREVSYLRNLALLVLLGTSAAALIDYVFKTRAVEAYHQGEELMRFFAVFYTVTGLLAFIVQSTLSRVTLERAGLARTVASLPLTVALGSAGALLFPGLGSAAAARGTETVLRSSLFRSGYELLYTPIPKREKRAAKAIADVGFDRMGDALGGGIVRGILFAAPLAALNVLLGLAVVFSLVGLYVATRLHAGYIRTLERSLLRRAVELEVDEIHDRTTRTLFLQTFGTIELHRTEAGRGAAPRGEEASSPAAARRERPLDPLVQKIVDLRSSDPDRIRAVLRGGSLHPALVAHVIPLLAWDEVCADAILALSAISTRVSGTLIDALLDPEEEFAVRRRIPRVLVSCPTDRVENALFAALEDRRFEVRYQCARALSILRRKRGDAPLGAERVYRAVESELAVDKRVWESRRLLDRSAETADGERSPFEDETLQGRVSRSLEHVFTLLSLELERQPLQIAYRGLHTRDDALRGTALEYLESVLPKELRAHLWPFLEAPPPPVKRRPKTKEEVLQTLLRSNVSIRLDLEKLPKTERET